VLGERFSVKASGDAGSIDELKTADLAGLEALKNQGIKKKLSGSFSTRT
jgi:hypothetical protein